MLNRIAVPVLLLVAIIFALQLTPEPAKGADTCPTLSVSGTQSGVNGAQFVADVSGTDSEVSYNWAISAGTIEQGQGTPVISVVEVGEPGTTVTATVDLGGLPPSCYGSDSATVEIQAPEAQ